METANRRMAAQAMSTLPRYAGGGFIDGLKRAVGLKEDTPEQKAYKERAVAERAAAKAPKPAAATMAEPPKAITGYAGGTATSERMKAMDAMATGGPIEGPGTGTSDEVPILASNGEYVIRAAAVEEVGTEVLDAINKLGDDKEPGEAMEKAEDPDANMEATEGNYPGEAMEEENRPKYATGGIINKFGTEVPNSEEQQRQLAAQTSNYVAGAQANAAARPAAQVMAANPVTPQSVANIPTGGTGSGPTPAAAPAVPVQSEYARDMGKVGKFFTDGAVTALKTLVSAPGYGFNKPAAPGATPAQAAPVAAPAPAPQLAKPATPQANPSAPNPASGSPDQVMPEGKVDVSMQPNGVKSFSGKDISGQPQYTGSAANTMKSGVMNSVPGMSQSEITKTLTNPDGSQWSSRDNAIMAANIRDGVDPYRGTSQGQANDLRALALSPNGTPGKSNAMKLLAMQSDEKRTTGQQQIERDRNSTVNQGTSLDNQSKQQVLAAQQELANAKTPDEEAAAEKKLRALQGKYGKDLPELYAYAPGGQSIDPVTGQVVTQPGVIFNKSTGEVKQPGQSKSIEADPRAIAIRDNKNLTHEQKLAELKKIGYQ